MQIFERRHDKTTILDLSGNIDFQNSPEVRQSMLREIRGNRMSRVLVNLSQVGHIDSSGIASLVEGLRTARALGSRLILFGLSTHVQEVLHLFHLDKLFEVYESEAQALSS